MTKNTWLAAAFIGAGAVIVTALIGPAGNFPLSDDWSYAYAVRRLCEEGTVGFLPWTGASLILQMFYGTALCKLFGFSFTILRGSTLVMATLGVFGFWLVLRETRVPRSLAVLALIVLALDPLYLNVSFSFMTDVPFSAVLIWATLFYLRGLKTGRAAPFIVGSIIAAASIFIRQHGIFLGAAAALAALIVEPEDTRNGNPTDALALNARLRNAAIAGTLPAIALASYFAWIYGSHLATSGLDNKLREATDFHVLTGFNSAFRSIVTLGLLISPFALVVGRRMWRKHRLRTTICTGLVTAAAAFLFAREQALMFYLPNVLYDFGVGPITLRDTQFLGLSAPWALGLGFTVPLTLAACASTGVLTSLWVGAVGRLREPAIALFVLATAALFAGSLLHTYYYFDRYLIAFLPAAIAGSAVLCTPRERISSANIPAWVAAAAIAVFAVAGTHDYMAWNRARFEGLSEIGAKGVRPIWVDGGVEYNAWLFAAAMQTWPSDAEARRGQSPDKKSWWWVIHDDYVVSFRELSDYDVYLRKPYSRWLPPGRGEVLILVREKPHVAFVPKP